MKRMFDISVPGGGDGNSMAPLCENVMLFDPPVPGESAFRLTCTLDHGHYGRHEAGMQDGDMVATWDDDRSTD